MSFFNFLQKSGTGSSTVKPLQIRHEAVDTSRSPKPQPNNRLPPSTKTVSAKRLLKAQVKERNDSVTPPRGKPPRKRACSEQVLKSSSEESELDNVEKSIKRVKRRLTREIDLNRHIRSEQAFDPNGSHTFPMVHAADITSSRSTIKFVPAFSGIREGAEVCLQYPSLSQKEKYNLVKPQYGHDDFEAVEDIVQMMRTTIQHYLPPEFVATFEDETFGYPQRLSRAVKRHSEAEVYVTISDWNTALLKLINQGTIASVLDSTHSLEPKLVERILNQTYSRIVSPRVKSLRDYENGTDNVYGELLPKFVSAILRDTCMTSEQVFVDLGSGVGNVVLQAALEIGCESWGCEMMPNACDLAELQREEFKARCQLWGLTVGKICLERGDFLTNGAISKIIPRADVVLVNNQAFTPELNEGLTSLFLDLREGSRIVSLKSFVPTGHKITARNLNSPYNILAVQEKEYYSGCVSWTNAPGTYYVSTKDSRKIRAFSGRSSAPESL